MLITYPKNTRNDDVKVKFFKRKCSFAYDARDLDTNVTLQEDLQKRQRDRALKVKEDQLRRARDEARAFNLKRSAELNVCNIGQPEVNEKNRVSHSL